MFNKVSVKLPQYYGMELTDPCVFWSWSAVRKVVAMAVNHANTQIKAMTTKMCGPFHLGSNSNMYSQRYRGEKERVHV